VSGPEAMRAREQWLESGSGGGKVCDLAASELKGALKGKSLLPVGMS
jgi:hypothetical protein